MLESNDGAIRIKGFSLNDCIGRNVKCEDGVTRRIIQITPSQRYYDMFLVNEVNEDETPGGTWVHALELTCMMHGEPPPTKEQKVAFSKAMSAVGFLPEPDQTMPGYTKLPSGIILSN